LQAARLDVSTYILQNRYDFAFLRNGGMPAAMVIGPTFAESAEREAFERQYHEQFSGVNNSGRVAFAYSEPASPLVNPNGSIKPAWDVKVLGLSQKDSQAIERMRDLAVRICSVFGTPMSKVGDASERTFNNVVQEDINWNRETLIPYAADYLDDINIQLAPRLGSDVAWFDTSDVDALESKNWTAVPITDLFDRGIAGADWVADEVGIPHDEMGTPVEPNTAAVAQKELGKSGAGPTPARESVDLAAEGEPLAASAAKDAKEFRKMEKRLGGKKVTPGDEEGTARLHKYWVAGPGLAKWRGNPHPWTALYHHLRKYIHPDDFARRTAATWFHEVFGIWPGTPHSKPGDETFAMPVNEIFEQRRKRAWNDANMRATALESQYEIEMRSLFAKQRDFVLSRLEGRRGKAALRAATGDEPPRVPPAEAVFDAQHWQDETARVAAQLYRSIATVAGTSIADKLGTAFSIHADRVARFIRDRAQRVAQQVTATTFDAIREQLNAGVAEGESIPQLAKRIRHLFQVASDTRARTIARTEVISAYNGASEATVASYGADVVGGKEWIATHDTRTREDHRHADGQIKGMAEPFIVGGVPMTYPGDPIAPPGEVVNCRCTIGFLTPADMAERGLQVRSTQLTPAEARQLFHLIQGGNDAA
jgi:SPP1 gp7 family putative phage head morphogenesis protein